VEDGNWESMAMGTEDRKPMKGRRQEDIRGKGREGVDCIQLAPDMEHLWDFVKTVMKIWSVEAVDFLDI
jgi:hypothetical protein